MALSCAVDRMEKIYNANPEWILDRPKQLRRARAIAIISTIAALLISLFLGKWLVLIVVVLGMIYWYFELKTGEIRYKDLYVKILDSGLFQSVPNSNEGSPITLLTPWDYLMFDSVERKNGAVESFRLIDKTLPTGVRTIKIENLERMDELFSEIRSRVGDISV